MKGVEGLTTFEIQPLGDRAVRISFGVWIFEPFIKGRFILEITDSMNASVRFALHEDLDEYYVEIVDRVTNEVIKKIIKFN